KLPQDCEYLKYILPNKHFGWWTSSQAGTQSNVIYLTLAAGSSNESTGVRGTAYHQVRAILSY
ncbi:MAG: hypothetical protein K2H04_02065, partial [Bacteroidaceae bacterium]|nr:hypothetical protein [Bacteroidaceae bacterium]